jgi:hypothetical protein
MIESSDRLGFALEPLPAFGIRRHGGRQHLDRDIAAQSWIAGTIDLAHPARSDGRDDLVRTEASADCNRHPCPGGLADYMEYEVIAEEAA